MVKCSPREGSTMNVFEKMAQLQAEVDRLTEEQQDLKVLLKRLREALKKIGEVSEVVPEEPTN